MPKKILLKFEALQAGSEGLPLIFYTATLY
jgi:hypothetical protein